MSAFCIGNMLGWTSPVQPLLESGDPPVGELPLSREQISWLGSINFIGAILGTLFWGRLSDLLGRRMTAAVVALPFALGWITVLAAQSVSWLYVGRLIVGIGCSGAMINSPMYVTEIAQDDIRGRLGSYLITFLNAGCVFCYIIGSYLSFHVFTGICLSIPILYSVLLIFVPESPVYLYTKNNREGAERSLLWYRGGDIVQTEKEMALLSSRSVRKTVGITALWATKGTIKAMFLGFGFIMGQQLCGILAILTYTVMIFKMSGHSMSPHLSAIIVGLLQLVSSFGSSMVVDKLGRRVLLFISYLAMSISMFTLGWYFMDVGSRDPSLGWIPVISLSVHVVAYSVGAGPVPFIVMAETFPPEVRGTATSVIQFLGTSLSFATVKTFPLLISLLGTHGCFWVYGCACLFLVGFTILCVPETKGKPLNVILKKLNGEEDGVELQTVAPKSTIVITKMDSTKR
ncbi:hypothetical protein AAG570_003569 [Ranatra chinensis]|uniref:Major facilitator superfamily (MFS) profile domain-containing protein n=1 Tax=Ranatra chinensis TaxID=642074 RepID=A0ABD0Y697_9HEMI